MSTRIQWRRGTTAEHAAFTGAAGEVTVDTTKDTVVVHDGSTAGGFPLASATKANTFTTQQSFTGTTAAAPAIAGAGDLNTGMLFPAADTVAISTGGAERMRIDANGNVGVAVAAEAGMRMKVAATDNQVKLTNGTNELLVRANSTEVALYTFQAVPMAFYTGNMERMRIDAVGNVLAKSPTGGLGYGTGAGGTVTQATSKSTAVTLNKPVGTITMHNEALGAGAEVQFTLNNSLLAATDQLLVTVNWTGVYSVRVVATYEGTAAIVLKNESGASGSAPVLLNFAIIKGSVS